MIERLKEIKQMIIIFNELKKSQFKFRLMLKIIKII